MNNEPRGPRNPAENLSGSGVSLTMNRRKFFQADCAMARLMAALGLAFLLPFAARAEDWPQWSGPNRDGVWNETGIMESFPPGGLKICWRAPVGRGWSSPVVAQGRVYVTDCSDGGSHCQGARALL